MKEGPDIARLGALIGDPARANMLTALLSGKALTASELATEAGVGAPTASAHLTRLTEAGLVRRRSQGRHRYYALADEDVGTLLEAMLGLAARRGLMRTRTGPSDPALRRARVCYNHLAGEMGVQMFDWMQGSGLFDLDTAAEDTVLTLNGSGRAFVAGFGIDLSDLEAPRRSPRQPLCRTCLDWSQRRTHLGGRLGRAMLSRMFDLGWAARVNESRVVRFTDTGRRAFEQAFPAVDAPAAAR